MLLQIVLSRANAPAVISLADRLQIDSVFDATESFLIDNLTFWNAVESLLL